MWLVKFSISSSLTVADWLLLLCIIRFVVLGWGETIRFFDFDDLYLSSSSSSNSLSLVIVFNFSAVDWGLGLVIAHCATTPCGRGVPTIGPLVCGKSSRRDADDEGANGGRLSPCKRCLPAPISFFFFPVIDRIDVCSSAEFVGSLSSKGDVTDRGIGDSFLSDEIPALFRLEHSWSSLSSSLFNCRLCEEDRGADIGGNNVFSCVVFDFVLLIAGKWFNLSFDDFSVVLR